MQVEIWSDIVCPFCGIGNQRLQDALAEFEHGAEVTVVHRSFQLDPSAAEGETRSAREMLRAKYGLTDEQMEANHRRIEADAHAIGLNPYILGDNRTGNTARAHEVLALARDRGCEAEAWTAMYRAYFGEARNIFDPDVLVDIATEIGLDRVEARAVLTDRRYASQVAAEAAEASAMGARGVPFVVIDRKYGVAGAQPTEVFRQALESAWADSHPTLVTIDGDDDLVCGPDGCAVGA